MKTLSTGDPSTLGNWREWIARIFGDESPAVTFLDERIARDGEDAAVLTDERQMLHMLECMHENKGQRAQ